MEIIPLFQWKESLYFNGKNPSTSMERIPLLQWKEFPYFNGKDPSISMERNDDNDHHHHLMKIIDMHFPCSYAPQAARLHG